MPYTDSRSGPGIDAAAGPAILSVEPETERRKRDAAGQRPAGEDVKRLRFRPARGSRIRLHIDGRRNEAGGLPLIGALCETARRQSNHRHAGDEHMNSASSLGGYGWWLLSWLGCLALAALLARVLAVGSKSPENAVADVFDAVLTRKGRVSFLRTSALGALLTVIWATALLTQARGNVLWSQINVGALLVVLASGLIITLLPHYLLCRWLRRPLRDPAADAIEWMMARIARPMVAAGAALAIALALVVFFDRAMSLGDFLAREANAFPTVPDLFTYPGRGVPSESEKQFFVVLLFAFYALALQLSWPLAALLWDGARALARAIGRPFDALQQRGARTAALMALATALHLLLLPVLL
jgi:hypothetical protein